MENEVEGIISDDFIETKFVYEMNRETLVFV
jgi:hypothetical protein